MKNELSQHRKQLPDTVPELSRFVLIGREKLTAVRAEIRAIDKVSFAKDVRQQKLLEAQQIAEAVLDAEVRIGQLLRDIPTHQGKRSDLQLADSTVQKSKKEVIDAAGLNVKQAQRFEALASHPDIVERMKVLARDNDDIVNRTAILDEISKNRKSYISNNSGDEEWLTPAVYIEAARSVMGSIDLDPASNEIANRTVQATHYFTKEDDGLQQAWCGNIWLNPPYGNVSPFIEKLINSPIDQAIILVNNGTETAWFRKLADYSSAMVFLTGRVRFEKPDGPRGTPLQGQVIVYIGHDPDKFLDIFQQFGWGVRPAAQHTIKKGDKDE